MKMKITAIVVSFNEVNNVKILTYLYIGKGVCALMLDQMFFYIITIPLFRSRSDSCWLISLLLTSQVIGNSMCLYFVVHLLASSSV